MVLQLTNLIHSIILEKTVMLTLLQEKWLVLYEQFTCEQKHLICELRYSCNSLCCSFIDVYTWRYNHKIQWKFKLKACATVKDSLLLIPFKNISLTSNTGHPSCQFLKQLWISLFVSFAASTFWTGSKQLPFKAVLAWGNRQKSHDARGLVSNMHELWYC